MYKLIFSCCFSYSLLFSGDRGGTVLVSQNNFSCSKRWKGITTKSKSDKQVTKDHFMHKNPLQLVHELLSSNNNLLTDHHLVWMNRNFFLHNEMFSVFLYFINNSIFYWFMFTIFNINFLKRYFYLCYTKISLYTASITHAQECFAKAREMGKKFIRGCVVLQSFKH